MAQMVTPVARDGYVYGAANSIGGGLVRLKSVEGGVSADKVYFARGLPNSLGGSVLVGDYLYGTGEEGLVAMEFTTGKVKWQAEGIGGGVGGLPRGVFFFLCRNGDVAAVG